MQGVFSLKKKAVTEEAQVAEQVLMRTLEQVFGEDCRSAGYHGTRGMEPFFPLNTSESVVYGFSYSQCHRVLSTHACERMRPYSEGIIFYHVPHHHQWLTKDMESPEAPLHASVREGATVLISDWTRSETFVATAVIGTAVFHGRKPALSKQYPKGARVSELQTIVYYSGVPDRQGSALYREVLGHSTNELVEGVESVAFYYQVDQRFLPTRLMRESDWPRVKKIRLVVTRHEGEKHEYEFTFRNGHYSRE